MAPAPFLLESLRSESFLTILDEFLVVHEINEVFDGRNLLATAIYHYISFFNRENPTIILDNIEHIVERGGDPQFCRTIDGLRYASCAEVALLWGRLELFKVLVQSRHFKMHKMKKSSFFTAGQCPQLSNYFCRLETEYQNARHHGISYVANYVRPLSHMLLLNALSGQERALLQKIHQETEGIPHTLRAVFFNKESSAARLAADVAKCIAAFLVQGEAKRALLREYNRLM
jgi:hypothetical protein